MSKREYYKHSWLEMGPLTDFEYYGAMKFYQIYMIS